MNKKSILRMAKGAIEERVDCEMAKIVDNILDMDTKAAAKRRLTVTLDFLPDDERCNIRISAVAKSTLVPTNPVTTALYVGANIETGEVVISELRAQIPGQLAIDGTEEEQPSVLKLLV